jgi:hypothetical protein
MIENLKIRPASVIGPLGEPLTIETLPATDTRHWVIRRKAEVLAAVHGGLLSIEEVCERYDLSLDEFMLWRRAVERSGMYGLRVTRVQLYEALYAQQDEQQVRDVPPRTLEEPSSTCVESAGYSDPPPDFSRSAA